MGNIGEIKFNFDKIDEQISALKALQKRAYICSNMKLDLRISRGDAADALLTAHESMGAFAGTVAIMLKDIIDDLNDAKTKMKQEDEAISKKMTSHLIT